MIYWIIGFMFLSVVSTIAAAIRTDYMQYVAIVCATLSLGFAALTACLAEINDSIKNK